MKTSLTGYKKNSKDRNEPLLEIPSNSITMEGVTHPVVSVLEDGSFKVMKPNENYLFNTKSVIEIPMKNKKQKGGLIKDFESYLSSLKEEDQDQVIDYIESLGSDEQEMFLKGGMTMWKKYQQGGIVSTQSLIENLTEGEYEVEEITQELLDALEQKGYDYNIL